MNDYFIKLINYDGYANRQILAAMNKVDSPKSMELMAHILAAQQVWLNRCLKLPLAQVVLWAATPDGADFENQIDSNNKAWVNCINAFTAGDFEAVINYKTSNGVAYQSKLTDILAHLINHGTHHRAQIGVHLKMAGLAELPILDYIFYIRQTNQ